MACLQAFIIKLNEEQLRPIVVKLTKWGMKAAEEEHADCIKATTLCQALSGILEVLKEFFLPMFGVFFEPVLMALINQ